MADYDDWMQGWMKSQQQFWQNLSGPPQASATEFWSKGLKQWWDAVAGASATTPAQEMYEKMVNMGRSYLSLAEQMGSSSSGDDAMAGVNEWLETMQNWFSQVAAGGSPTGPWGGADKGAPDFMAFWDMPMDTLQRTAAAIFPLPGDFTKAFHPDFTTPADYTREHLNRFLSIPALGYSREAQGQQQKLLRLAMDYQSATQAYRMAFAKVALKSMQRFQRQLQEMVEKGEAIDSIRAWYDLWVDACEKDYADFLRSEEYPELYGNLVNATMALKHQAALMVDEMLEAFNIPSRAEVDTMQRRQHERRRELLALQAEVRELKAALEEMQARMQGAGEQEPAAVEGENAGGKRAAAGKAATRKKAAKKKTSGKTAAQKAAPGTAATGRGRKGAGTATRKRVAKKKSTTVKKRQQR